MAMLKLLTLSALLVGSVMAVHYESVASKGWCTPYGSGGGDLCRPPVSAQNPETCKNVDSNYYHSKDDERDARNLCSLDPACVGYTRRKDGRLKLKDAISGVSSSLNSFSANFQCFRKPHTYELLSAEGSCTPGNNAGDLCRPPVSAQFADTCENLDANYYTIGCDVACGERRCSRDQNCAGFSFREFDGAVKFKQTITGVHGGFANQCFRKPKSFRSVHESGFCTPWGSTGGDLCRPPSPHAPHLKDSAMLRTTCANLDSTYYNIGCNAACGEQLCSKENRCVGFTVRKSDGAVKLKSAISGIGRSSGFHCYEKYAEQCSLANTRFPNIDQRTTENAPYTTGCRPGFEKASWNGLCFPKCGQGFKRIEGLGCVEYCRGGYTQVLGVCTKTETKAVSCEKQELCHDFGWPIGRRCAPAPPKCGCESGFTQVLVGCVKHHTYGARIENAGIDFASAQTKNYQAVLPTFTFSTCHSAGFTAPTDDRFTIIFLADLEVEYRDNSREDARKLMERIAALTESDVRHFNAMKDPTISEHYRIKPELVIHGGDMSGDFWDCHGVTPCKQNGKYKTLVKDFFKEVFGPLYEKGIPMITGLGNHDWLHKLGKELQDSSPSDAKTRLLMGGENFLNANFQREAFFHESNMKSVQVTRESYKNSLQVSPHFSFQEFAPKKKYGQVTAKAEYKGVQIVDFMNHPWQPSYDFKEACAERDWTKCLEYAPGDTQYDELVSTLDEDKPAIFVHHFPLNRWGTVSNSHGSDSPAFINEYCQESNTCNGYTEAGAKSKYLGLVNKFNQGGKSTRVFSGHNHIRAQYDNVSGSNVTELVAPYPLKDRISCKPGPTCSIDQGVYAVLVDPKTGVVEVQWLDHL